MRPIAGFPTEMEIDLELAPPGVGCRVSRELDIEPQPDLRSLRTASLRADAHVTRSVCSFPRLPCPGVRGVCGSQ